MDKKVYLNCYLIKNLGDDLFLKIISERYKNIFFTVSSYKYNNFSNNLKIRYRSLPIKIIDKFTKILKKYVYSENNLINKADIVVVLAGSVFIELENGYKVSNWYKNLNKNYYILGSNVGPYYTEEFLEDAKEVMRHAEDVCLRDKKSAKLCKEISTVRQASDIIFSLDVSKYKKVPERKKVIFSVINCDKKSRQIRTPNRVAYESKICGMIEFFTEKGYEIELMSFCKREGDEEAVDSIISKLKFSKNVKKYYYDGNIEEALMEIASSKIIVGTRLHANILGLDMNKTIIPIAYNNKTIEIMKDIDFRGKIIDINEIESFDVHSITEEDLNYKCDISFQKNDALKHFMKLDEILDLKEYI